MTSSWIRPLRTLVAATALLAFSACSSMGSMALPAGLTDALVQVTGLSGKIDAFKSGLDGMLDSTGLGKLQDLASEAGNLGKTVTGFKDQLSAAAADPLAVIGNKLSEMGGMDASALKDLAPQAQMEAVEGFAESASGVSSLVTDFLKNFGS